MSLSPVSSISVNREETDAVAGCSTLTDRVASIEKTLKEID